MINWDDEPDYTLIPIEQLRAEAERIAAAVELREHEVIVEGLRWRLAKLQEVVELAGRVTLA